MEIERTHTTDVRSDASSDTDRQMNTDSVCPNGLDSTLPMEGYCIFDARPIKVSLSPLAYTTSAVPYASLDSLSPDAAGPSKLVEALSVIRSFTNQYWSRVMLVFVPLGLVAAHMNWNASIVFALNCCAIVPLADVLCQATDSLASFMGDTTGALINVTMGNLTELVIFIQAMVHRQYIIVRTSLLGSIIVNILLVLGLAILTGETRERSQVYNALATKVAAGLLCLTTVSLLLPSTLKLAASDPTTTSKMTTLSRATSIVLIFVYFLYLWTQIASAKYAYKPLIQLEDQEGPDMMGSVELSRPITRHQNLSYPSAPLPSPPLLSLSDSKSYDSFDTDARESCPSNSLWGKTMVEVKLIFNSAWAQKLTSAVLLIVSTGLISVCSENLVSRVDQFVAHSPISKTMVGLIILPIVGNAAELVSGIMFASRRQMDLAFAISIGSAIQIALFVTPVIVLIGWGIDRDMSLQFTPFESIALAASSALFLMLVFDDRCSVLKGACLCAGFAVIAIASYFVTDGE